MPDLTTEDILAVAEIQPEPQLEQRDPELVRVAKLLAEKVNSQLKQGEKRMTREEAWAIVEAKGPEIKAKQEAERAARVAAEKAQEAAEAEAKAAAAKAALDAMLGLS